MKRFTKAVVGIFVQQDDHRDHASEETQEEPKPRTPFCVLSPERTQDAEQKQDEGGVVQLIDSALQDRNP